MVIEEVPIYAWEYVGMHLCMTFQRLYTFKSMLYVYLGIKGSNKWPLKQMTLYTYRMNLKVYNLWNVMHKCMPTYSSQA